MSLLIGELMSSEVVGLSLVYKPVSWLVLHSSQFMGALKIKTTSLCFYVCQWSGEKRLLGACLSAKPLVLAPQSTCTVTTNCFVLALQGPWSDTTSRFVLMDGRRMACKRNSNTHSFLWYRWVWLGITPLAALRNGTAKLVFATI